MTVERFEEFLSPSQAARVAGVAAETIRYHWRTGRLPAVIVPPGRRLFRVTDIQAFARERAAQRKEAGHAEVPEED